MLGIIFEITNTILYDENILLGHLFNFKKLNMIELDSLKKDGEKTFEELKIHDKKMILHLSSEEKRARNHKLISIGALFEIAEITNINLGLLIGFVNSLHSKNNYYLTQCELDGKLYFIPTTGTTCRLFYNKEIFERVGIEQPPQTLEEMVEDAKLITSQLSGEGIYGFAENMKSAASGLQRSMAVGLQRETGKKDGYDFAKGEYDFTDWEETLKLWTELLSEECAFPGCESLDIDPLRTQFAAGKIGMYMSYSHAEPGVYANQFPMDSEKWDCVPIPTVGNKTAGKQYYNGTSGYVLNAKSPNLELAFKVYKDLFTTEDYLVGYYEGGYGVSIIPSVIEKAKPSADFQNKKWLLIDPEFDTILPKPPHNAFAAGMVVEGEDMWKTCESIYYGGADAASTLQDLTDRYNKAYQDAIANGTGYEVKIENYDPMNPTLQ